MKDIVTPVPPEEVRSMIKKSLETAALVNYTKLSGEAKIEGESHFVTSSPISHLPDFFNAFTEDLRGDHDVPPAKKLEDLIHLAELCVDLLQQNDEHYAEVFFPSFSLSKTIYLISKLTQAHKQTKIKNVDIFINININVSLIYYNMNVFFI